VRILYNLAIYVLQIPVAAYWTFRALTNRSYRPRVGQRFGLGYPRLGSCIWLHAVSVGEVQAAAPLVRQLARRFPERRILVTTVTPTGAAQVEALFGDSVTHCYIPFEMPIAVKRFFAAVKPEIALVMETEIWPNLYRGCGVRGIPLVLVSARISPRSVGAYRRLLPLFRETLSHGIIIAAQSEADAERFRSLGASPEKTWVTGNIKFDVETDPGLAEHGRQLRREIFPERRVWIAASTHEGEEQQLLEAHAQLRNRYPDLLLALVPRHPERFGEVRALIERAGFACVARTEGRPCQPETAVFLGDTMGELNLFYAASDIAFVAGSLVPVGGHNVLEPAALGLPFITGRHYFNSEDIVQQFLDLDACRIVDDAAGLAGAVAEFLDNPEAAAAIGRRGREILEQNRGALARLFALLEPFVQEPEG
jgi:3-deoxy-D-manno-octulosonic-acid transferase